MDDEKQPHPLSLSAIFGEKASIKYGAFEVRKRPEQDTNNNDLKKMRVFANGHEIKLTETVKHYLALLIAMRGVPLDFDRLKYAFPENWHKTDDAIKSHYKVHIHHLKKRVDAQTPVNDHLADKIQSVNKSGVGGVKPPMAYFIDASHAPKATPEPAQD